MTDNPFINRMRSDMRKVTSLLISFILGLIMVATLVTAGILTGVLWMYIIAAWASVVLLVVFLGFYFRTYRRIMTRTGTANERLAEIKLLQERRYEQLAQRLDVLSQGTFGQSRSTAGAISSGQQPIPQFSDIEHTIARVERAERRILGMLENISLDNDTRFRTVEKFASICGDHKELK